MKWFLLLAAFFALNLSAADVTGTWKGSADTPNGKVERTFVFKSDGAKLTGETSSEMLGKSTIEDGKIEGDTLSFNIKVKFQDNEMTLHYTGKVSGDEIKFHVEGDQGISLDYTAKKLS